MIVCAPLPETDPVPFAVRFPVTVMLAVPGVPLPSVFVPVFVNVTFPKEVPAEKRSVAVLPSKVMDAIEPAVWVNVLEAKTDPPLEVTVPAQVVAPSRSRLKPASAMVPAASVKAPVMGPELPVIRLSEPPDLSTLTNELKVPTDF